jgi:hypothetical protein
MKFDTYTTLIKMAGASMPTDRMVDGVDQSDFLLADQKHQQEKVSLYL